MSDLFEMPEPEAPQGQNAPEFTVSELSGAVKRVIEGEFGRVRVRGEIGRVSRPGSGHLYFDLKDDRATLAAIVWKGQASRLALRPEEGLEVIASGRLTTFPGQSKYQMIVDDIAPAGMGALMAMLEKRRAALAAEGLFDPERKQALPYLPTVIGVITSPSGAVIRDILHRLRDRFPSQVVIWPVAVQGDRCAPDVAAAIRGFNALAPGGPVPRPDLLIVARGGGSVEDLWGFNDEAVVRAAAESAIPLISAVGHETDTTLIDHAADRRAPTPTAAAEMAVPVLADLQARLSEGGARLIGGIQRGQDQRSQRLRDVARALPRADALMGPPRQRLDYWAERLPMALRGAATAKRVRFGAMAALMRADLLLRFITNERRGLSAPSERLHAATRRGQTQKARDLARLNDRLSPQVLMRPTQEARRALDALSRRLNAAAQGQTATWRARLDGVERLRQTLGYEQTLRRGYAVVRGDDQVVKSRAEALLAKRIEIQFHDGRLELAPRAAARKPTQQPDDGSPDGGGQPSLF